MAIRWSQFFLPTLREDPKDAEVISHTLMVRAGLIRRLGSGAYSYLPLGMRVLQKVTAIVREEMNRAGAQECLLPALQPMDLWKTTGRDVLLGEVLLRIKDRTGKEMVLGPTHEEVITSIASEMKSYRQLPFTLYQIQTKFRDEPRPRAGVIRSKEFLMKDAYSFDVDAAGLDRSYQRMVEAYHRIFRRCGVTVLACEADPGMMGGSGSNEFMAPSPNGEDQVVTCAACGFASNLEAAACPPLDGPAAGQERPKPMEEVHTPGQYTVEQVSQFLKVTPPVLLKTLLYETDAEPVAAVIRGDHELNEVKLARALNVSRLKLATAATIERVTGAPMGFSGPIGLKGVRLIADHAAMRVVNAVTGANKAETHVVNVNPGRDFTPATVTDLRVVTPQDACPRCGKPIEFVRAIEAGHVFKLGTKYSQALGATFQDAGGKHVPMIMGCYGIGINRIIASAIEQRHDVNGILWPVSIAPFHVVISVLEMGNAEVSKLGEELSQQFAQQGVDVLLDNRDLSPGAKLKDADLIGVPVQIVLGKVWQTQQKLEVVERASKTKQQVERAAVVASVQQMLDKLATL